MARKDEAGMYIDITIAQKKLIEMVASSSNPRKSQKDVVRDAVDFYLLDILGKDVIEKMREIQGTVAERLSEEVVVNG